MIAALLLLVVAAQHAPAPGRPVETGVVAVEQALLDIGTIGRVMNLAAHPDDEDGATLAYCRHGQGLATVAVFANRGEGGQNEIGPELYDELGVIRERETLAATALEGAEAYFLDLDDFGYSKSVEESLARWGGEDVVVERVVRAIREYRPDVIFTNHDPEHGHSNHRVLAIAARKAFDLAGDPNAFPDQLDGELRPWAPALYLERLGGPGATDEEKKARAEIPESEKVKLLVDVVDPIRGTTYREQAHAALQEHKSQGRWTEPGPKEREWRVIRRRDEQFLTPKDFPFDAVNLTRLRIFRAIAAGAVTKEEESALLAPDVLQPKLPPARERAALVDALSAHRDRLAAVLTIAAPTNGGAGRPDRVELAHDWRDLLSRVDAAAAATNGVRADPSKQSSPALAPPRFIPQDVLAIGRPGAPTVEVRALLELDLPAPASQPASAPAIPARRIGITQDAAGPTVFECEIPAGAGGKVSIPVRFDAALTPGEAPKLYLLGSIGSFRARRIDVDVAPGLLVGIVASYDDTLETAVKDLGVDARLLSADDLAFRDLDRFDAILIDLRAYFVRDDLVRFNSRVLDYARGGGVVAVFYQKTFEWRKGHTLAPYPLDLSNDRVVDETAPVTLLLPDHPLLTRPNRIAASDFDGWIHERGLYFPKADHAPQYQELLAMSDPSETPLKTGLLVAPVGRGAFVYTSLGWYRQWRNHNAGAYRFLANLISLKRSLGP